MVLVNRSSIINTASTCIYPCHAPYALLIPANPASSSPLLHIPVYASVQSTNFVQQSFNGFMINCVLQPNSCGFGTILPSSSVHAASLDKSSPILAGLPQNGCGACVQVTCTDPAPVSTTLASKALWRVVFDESHACRQNQ